jgi:hypothetical protein
MPVMMAPATVAANSTFKSALTGTTYTVDAQGFVTVTAQIDVNYLMVSGFLLLWGGRNNFTATTDPVVGSDTSIDYAPGSIWINTTPSAGRVWICKSAALGAAVWVQISVGNNTAGSATFSNLTLTALMFASFTSAVTPFSGGGQSSATALTTMFNNVSSSVASSAPFDSVKLEAATAGTWCVVLNSSANNIEVYPAGTDAINAFAASAGVIQVPTSVVIYFCTTTGTWNTVGLNSGFSTNDLYNTNSSTSGTTLTAANVSGGLHEVTLAMTGTLGGDSNAQLPLVTALVTAIPNAAANMSYKLRVINESSANHVWTITTNTGWTLNGTMTIAQNTWRDFYVTLVSLTTATLQNLGTGTYS